LGSTLNHLTNQRQENMLKTIASKSHHLHRAPIDSFLDHLKQHQNVSFFTELLDKTTFLIASAEKFPPSVMKAEGGIYAGTGRMK
jgi:hypothetical protein